MEFHPAANIFPMMNKDEFESLCSSVQQNGQQHPILLFENKILDGRNRFAACLKLGIDPNYQEWQGDDPWEYVWMANAERRHLEPMQKALIKIKQLEGQEEWQRQKEQARDEANKARSEKQAGIPKAEYQERAVSTDTARSEQRDERARYEVARQANVSNATAARASALWNSRPDLAEEVIAGNLRPTEAERQRKRDEYIERQPELPKDKYRVIYADPPWSYGNTQPDYHGVQDDHYPIMKLSEICALPIMELVEDDAVLFLWVTSPILEESFQVIKAWGFEYKSSFIWDKIKHNMGHYNSVRHEILLICTRGSCTPDNRKLFDSVYQEERTEHSRKPEYFRDVIDTIYPHGKRIELFARSKHGNWDNYGNESLS